jgi:hypothetical protein
MPVSFTWRGRPAWTKRALFLAVLALVFSMVALNALPASAASAATLQATSTSAGLSPTFGGSGFSPNERIDLWLTPPSGADINYGYTYADQSGNFSGFTYQAQTLNSSGELVAAINQPLAAGTWQASGRGDTSNWVAVTSFEVAPVTLQASTLSVNGNQVSIQFSGANYYPGEKIFLWLTDSNGSVIDLGYCWATGGGQMPAEPVTLDSNGNPIPPTSPQNVVTFTGSAGQYKMTAYGSISGQTAITDLKV